MLDCSKKGEYTKKQNEKLKGSIKLINCFKIKKVSFGDGHVPICPGENEENETQTNDQGLLLIHSDVESFLLMKNKNMKFVSKLVSKLSISFRFYEMIPKIPKSQIVPDFILKC